MKTIPWIYALPAGSVLVWALIVGLGGSSGLEWKVYDVLLQARPVPAQNKDLVLLEVDSRDGSRPTADNLLLLKELGVRSIALNAEVFSAVPHRVDYAGLTQGLPAKLDQAFRMLTEANAAQIQASAARRLTPADAADWSARFQGLVEAQRNELITTLDTLALDPNLDWARSLAFFDQSYLPIRVEPAESQALSALPPVDLGRFSVSLLGSRSSLNEWDGAQTPVEPFLGAVRGLGFAAMPVDSDGTGRRFDLFFRQGPYNLPHLAFAPFWAWVGHPGLEVTPDAFILRGARYPDGRVYDLSIPRAEDGSVLLNGPRVPFDRVFRHLSVAMLDQHDQLFTSLVEVLEARSDQGYWDRYQGDTSLLVQAQNVLRWREELLDGRVPGEAVENLRTARDGFLQELGLYLATRPELALVQGIRETLAQEGWDDGQRASLEERLRDLPVWFTRTKVLYEDLTRLRKSETALGFLQGVFCIAGATHGPGAETRTTSSGHTYPLIGTQASLVNMLLQRQFITDASPWWSWGLGLVLALALTHGLRRAPYRVTLAVGGAVWLGAGGLLWALFLAAGLYLPQIPMTGITICTVAGLGLLQFLQTQTKRNALVHTVGRSLSSRSLHRVLNHPEQTNLGSQRQIVTILTIRLTGIAALKTADDPERLAPILNYCYETLGTILWEHRGTIDRFDEAVIRAVFGVPLKEVDHALRACRAALQIKRIEGTMNRFLEGHWRLPVPLGITVGIVTGSEIVGLWGAQRKQDYAVLGTPAFFSRGMDVVRQRYSVPVVVAAATRDQIGDQLVTRRLGQVELPGPDAPVRVHELIEERSRCSAEQEIFLAAYDEAFDHFEARRWTAARQGFEVCLRTNPGDGPSLWFHRKAQEYEQTPQPPENRVTPVGE